MRTPIALGFLAVVLAACGSSSSTPSSGSGDGGTVGSSDDNCGSGVHCNAPQQFCHKTHEKDAQGEYTGKLVDGRCDSYPAGCDASKACTSLCLRNALCPASGKDIEECSTGAGQLVIFACDPT